MTRTLLAPSDTSRARLSTLSSKRAERRDIWTEPLVQRLQQQQQIRQSGEVSCGYLLIRLPSKSVVSRLGVTPPYPLFCWAHRAPSPRNSIRGTRDFRRDLRPGCRWLLSAPPDYKIYGRDP